MRWLLAGLLMSFIGLQARLWLGENSVPDYLEIKEKLHHQQSLNQRWQRENDRIARKIQNLINSDEGVQEYARSAMGMVAKDEVFYHMTDDQ